MKQAVQVGQAAGWPKRHVSCSSGVETAYSPYSCSDSPMPLTRAPRPCSKPFLLLLRPPRGASSPARSVDYPEAYTIARGRLTLLPDRAAASGGGGGGGEQQLPPAAGAAAVRCQLQFVQHYPGEDGADTLWSAEVEPQVPSLPPPPPPPPPACCCCGIFAAASCRRGALFFGPAIAFAGRASSCAMLCTATATAAASC